MSRDLNIIVSNGFANGHHPRKIARTINAQISKINRSRAATLARTETIHAHAEGSLDSMERLGVEKVQGRVEWLTAGDDKVCPLCIDLDGVVLTTTQARGLIPRHPNCRCAWLPYFPDKDRKQKAGAKANSSIRKSILKERGRARGGRKRTLAEAKKLTTWPGADVKAKPIPKKRKK